MKNNRRRNLTLYVVKISKAAEINDEHLGCGNSKPCYKCIDFMKKYGIKNVVYSTGDDNGYRKVKLIDLDNEEKHIPSSDRNTNYFNIDKK